jgi:hypothetical protein
MSSFETGFDNDHVGPGDILQLGPNTVVAGARRPVFFDRKEFNNAVREITHPDGDRAARAGESAPTASKARLTRKQQQVLDIYRQLWPDGYNGSLAKDRDTAIIKEFERRHKRKVSVRTILRALKSLKSD